MDEKRLTLNPLGAGGSSASGKKVVAMDQDMLTERLCRMSGDVQSSTELMRNMNKQQASMLPIQQDLLDKTITLVDENKKLNQIVIQLNKTGEKSLLVQERMAILSEELLKQTIEMTASTKLMQVQAEENMKQLNRNTAALFTSYVTKQGTVTEIVDGVEITRLETEFEWFLRILDNSEKLFAMYEEKRQKELKTAYDKI